MMEMSNCPMERVRLKGYRWSSCWMGRRVRTISWFLPRCTNMPAGKRCSVVL
jgi:hypothetical protein